MFRFKRFIVKQQVAAMKVGTDGVLLGAWAKLRPQHCRYLDIGTGTGLIALMLAQRTADTGITIDAVDIDEGSCAQARENAAASEWGDRINIFNASIQQFAAERIAKKSETQQLAAECIAAPIDRNTVLYDHIVSNPPYFVDSLLPASYSRSVARHARSLSYSELLSCVAQLLAQDGVFSAIIPFDRHEELIEAAVAVGLVATRRCKVFPLAGKPCKRVLLEFSHAASPLLHTRLSGQQPFLPMQIEDTELVIESAPEDFTPAYRALTCDFYLKF